MKDPKTPSGEPGQATKSPVEPGRSSDEPNTGVLTGPASPSENEAAPEQGELDLVTRIITQDLKIKDDIASMEHPVFSLSKVKDTKTRKYERNGNTIEVIPSSLGAATIWDKDLILFAMSHLVEAMRAGQPIGRRVQFVAHDFLVETGKKNQIGGRKYKQFRASLDRLAGTRIRTNIVTGGKRIRENFGLIDSYRIVEKSEDDPTMATIEVTLSEWYYNSVKEYEVLTLPKEYFALSGALERRICEIARKHLGRQKSWSISLESLHEKSGSQSTSREFRRKLKGIFGDIPRRLLGMLFYLNLESDELLVRQDNQVGIMSIVGTIASTARSAGVSKVPTSED